MSVMVYLRLALFPEPGSMLDGMQHPPPHSAPLHGSPCLVFQPLHRQRLSP